MFGNFSLFKTSFPGWSSIPTSFVSFFFVFYIFPTSFSKTMGCFSGCLMSSAGIQKLLWGFYSAFECSFDEFVGKKMISPSYSSTILGPPLNKIFKEQLLFLSLILSNSLKLQLWNFLLACTTMQSRTCLYISYFLQRVRHD